MLDKPAYGEACNKCGQCCERYPCPVGQVMFNQITGRCPALERDGVQQVCGLVAHPEKYNPFQTAVVGAEAMRKAALVMIGHGTGCDAIFVGERQNEAYRRSKVEEAEAGDRPMSPRFLRALQVWGVVRRLL